MRLGVWRQRGRRLMPDGCRHVFSGGVGGRVKTAEHSWAYKCALLCPATSPTYLTRHERVKSPCDIQWSRWTSYKRRWRALRNVMHR